MATQRTISLDALDRANVRLGQFIALYNATDASHPHHEALGAAVVKSFEFTYELAYSAIRRYVSEFTLSPGQVGRMRNADIIRAAAVAGLIDPPADWLIYRQRRNATAHEYFDESTIGRIIEVAPELHISVVALLKSLRSGE